MNTELGWALEEACDEGNLERVQSLVNPPSNPTPIDLSYALTVAASRGHSTTFSFLLDQGAQISSVTPVHASNGRSSAIFQALLDHDWDINSKGSTGAPSLTYVGLATH